MAIEFHRHGEPTVNGSIGPVLPEIRLKRMSEKGFLQSFSAVRPIGSLGPEAPIEPPHMKVKFVRIAAIHAFP